ncbi:MAG: SDR family oxidoreductase [Reyranella sp.]|uniref:SDR family NAD(P)-dependent oxidoreductase n=1 Tax=Reyranella sp. TaxID=1929291 RepID=UPI001ACCD708|nr:SDR family oxidoreductase [Reyranella sp.]MBN9089039.1 SDR family oxidoreductase [Reyranella sp.]
MTSKVALVTGSTSGIGAAIARRLVKDGYIVALHSARSAETGQAMAKELNGSYHQADLADEAATRALAASVLDRHGRLDVLVNNAGLSIRIPHADLKAATPALWRQMLDVNLISPFLLVAEAEAALRQTKGSIVNIGTHAGARPKGSSIPYAASKAALHHVTKLLALALAPDVRVNAVAPGLVETPMTANWPDLLETWNTRAPMRRPARPEDIADLVAALIANDYVTGEIVIADGGLNLT